MILEYRSAVLAMYELGVGEGYRDPDAVKRRYFTLPPLEEGSTNSTLPPLSAIRIDINVKWMNAAQEMLDAVLTCSTDTMRRMPNIMYTRFGMAVTSLLKIHFSVRTGALGQVVTADAVNVVYYLDAMANKLGEASGGGKYMIPTRWYHVVAIKGRDWLDRLENRYTETDEGAVGAGTMPGMVSVSESPAAATESMHSSQLPGSQETAHLEQVAPATVDSFSVAPGVAHIPSGMDGMRDGYVAMGSTGMWPMGGHGPAHEHHGHGHGHGHNHFYHTMAGGYHQPSPSHPQATMPPPFAYDPQRLAPQGGGIPGTGMELDGWLPDGSIFGMPPLPEF